MTEGRSPEAAEYVADSSRQQEVIDAVLDGHGGESVEAVGSALVRAFAEAGLTRPPEPWVEAVAAEIADGHRFVVRAGLDSGDEADDSGVERAAADDAASDLSVPATHPRELWFSHDPKIDHLPPAEAVEHRAAQEEG